MKRFNTLKIWDEEDLSMYRNILLISTCPQCGLTAILRNRDNVMLFDCNCSGKSTPWQPVPDGILIAWNEVQL